MNNTKKTEHVMMRALNWLIPLAIAVVAGWIAYMFGARFAFQNSWIFALCGLGCQVLLYVLALALRARINKQVQNVKIRQQRDLLVRQKQQVEQDERYASNELRKRVVCVIAWQGLLLILPVATCFFAGGADDTLWICAPCSLVSVYVLWSVISYMLISKNQRPPLPGVLAKDRFASHYCVLHEVFADEKIAPVFCLNPNTSVSVARINERVEVSIDPYVGAWLNESELKQVLLHERAHVLLDDRGPFHFTERVLERYDLPSAKCAALIPANALFEMPIMYLYKCYATMRVVASEAKEKRADRYAKEHGEAGNLAAALVKLHILDIYLKRELINDPLFFETETIQSDFYERSFDRFEQLYPKRAAFWNELIRKELPKLVSSHPSLPQRLQELNNPEYEINFSDPDPAFQAEKRELLQFYNELVVERIGEQYADLRKENYIKPKQVVADYIGDRTGGKRFTALELRPVIEAANKLEDTDFVIELCDAAIAASNSESEAAYALCMKGVKLMNRYDPEGATLMHRAAVANPNYLETANEEIGSFYLMMGMRKEMEEYRNYIVDLAQKKLDERVDEANVLRPNDRLSGVPILSEDALENQLQFIKDVCANALHSVYRVTKRLSDSLSCTVYIIRFERQTDNDERDRCMERVFEFLDGLDEQYALFDYDYAEEQKVPLNRIQGALIWKR